MTTLKIDRADVIAYRITAQGLHRTAASVTDLAVLDIGVQDTGAHAAQLAFDARLTKIPAPRSGPGQPLALAWTLRGAPHLHRRRDLDRMASALWPLSDADARTRLGETGARSKQAALDGLRTFQAGVHAIREVVDVPMAKGAASAAITAAAPQVLSRYCRVCKATHVSELVMRLGSLPAGLELQPGTSPPVLVPRPRARRIDGVDLDALHALVRAYLAMLGPATSADVAGYLGARRADLEAVWPDGLTEVLVDGRPAWLPADRVRTIRRPRRAEVVRLLGPFDPYLQARDRDLIVPDKAMHKALWPVLGRPGVLLADGEVVGSWRPRGSGTRLTIAVESFVPLPAATRARVEAEAQRVAAVRAATEVQVSWTGG